MEKTDEQLASLIEKLQEAGFAQAPEVFDGATRAIYLDGIMQVIATTVLVTLLVIAVGLVVTGAVREDENVLIIGVTCSPFLLLFTAMAGMMGNPWAKVFDPEAVFYYEVLFKVL